MPDDGFGVRENRARRMAKRQGMELRKSRRRDPGALEYGGYQLVDVRRTYELLGGSPIAFSASLNDVDRYLLGTPEQALGTLIAQSEISGILRLHA